MNAWRWRIVEWTPNGSSVLGNQGNQELILLIKYSFDWLDGNHHPEILKSISLINFPSLKTLYLYENEIESIEGIHRIGMPLIQILDLGANKLTSMKSGRKGHWPQLKNYWFCTCAVIKIATEFPSSRPTKCIWGRWQKSPFLMLTHQLSSAARIWVGLSNWNWLALLFYVISSLCRILPPSHQAREGRSCHQEEVPNSLHLHLWLN